MNYIHECYVKLGFLIVDHCWFRLYSVGFTTPNSCQRFLQVEILFEFQNAFNIEMIGLYAPWICLVFALNLSDTSSLDRDLSNTYSDL